MCALRAFFEGNPSRERMLRLMAYVRVLSHYRRNAIIRLLNETPGIEVEEIAHRTDKPRTTVDRILSQLDKAHIVDLDRIVRKPDAQPEKTLLELTVA